MIVKQVAIDMEFNFQQVSSLVSGWMADGQQQHHLQELARGSRCC